MSIDVIDSAQHTAQYILYETDAAEVIYADGTCIQLSPCGTTFICQQPLSKGTQHPLNGIISIMKICHYVSHWMWIFWLKEATTSSKLVVVVAV